MPYFLQNFDRPIGSRAISKFLERRISENLRAHQSVLQSHLKDLMQPNFGPQFLMILDSSWCDKNFVKV